MSGKAVDAGKQFIAGVLAKIGNADQRAAVEAAFNDPANADALVVVGSGALGQAEINRRFTEITAKESALDADRATLTEWYETRKTALTEYDAWKANGGQPPANTPPATPPAIDTTGLVSKDDLAKIMREEQLAAANFLGLQSVLTMDHYKKFGEIIDPRELLTDPQLGKPKPEGGVYGLKDAYQTKYATQLTAHAQAAEDARINKLVEERMAEERKKAGPLGIPLRSTPAPLDLLEDPNAKPDLSAFSAQAAADEYARLQAARNGSPV